MRPIAIFLLLIGSYFGSNAQVLDPVTWGFKSEHVADDEYLLTFTAKMDDPWKVYSQFTPEGGPVPTSINYESEGFEIVGKGEETGHRKDGHEEMFGIDVISFLPDQPFIIKQKVKAPSGTTITGYLTYMTCNDEQCLPPTDVEFSLDLVGSTGSDTETKSAPKSEPKAKAAEEQMDKQSGITINNPSAVVKEKATGVIGSVTNVATEKVTSTIGSVTDAATDQIAATTSKISIPSIGSIGNSAPPSNDNVKEPVQWDIALQPLGGDEYELTYTAAIEKTWNVYSQFTSDDGPYPTAVTHETEGVTLVGKSTETGHRKEGIDPMFEVNVIKFLDDEPYVIKQKIKAAGQDNIKGYLTYMACDATQCLPPVDVEFAFDLKSGKAIGYDSVDGGTPASTASNIAAVPPPSSGSGPNIADGKIDNKIPQLSQSFLSPLGNCGGGEESSKSLLGTFLLGFFGGLIALLTPCVFPMIPLTVSFFTKDTKRKGWVNGVIYGLCIIAIYVALGMGLTLIFGEEALNRLSVNWIANTIFFLIFIFFAFSFFGYYEITLPSSWSTKTDGMADKGGLLGIFFMAFTLALVSFSCTGPIIGSAIVSAASTGSKLGPAIVMGGFAFGLALPFGVFAAVPALLNSLPRSGGWMNSVKVVLGFLELALAFKFLSVADLTNDWGFLRYELFMAIWVLCFLGMALYLFGFIKFPHDSPIAKLSVTRKILGTLSAAFAVYLLSGFMINDKTGSYASKKLLSGLAPPSHYNFFLDKQESNKSIKDQYPSYSICANGIPCFKDYYEGKAYSQATNKPMFLDFTGHGCVNCRKVEEHIWIDEKVSDRLKDDWVLISLYVDEDTKLDEVYVSKERGNKIRNVGNMWADFQVLNFEQNSQPLYVMATPYEEVLAKPRGYVQTEGVEEYVNYMDCGYKGFEKATQ